MYSLYSSKLFWFVFPSLGLPFLLNCIICPKVAEYSNTKPFSANFSRRFFQVCSSDFCPLCPSSMNTKFFPSKYEISMLTPLPFFSFVSL